MSNKITDALDKIYSNRVNRVIIQIVLCFLGFIYGSQKAKEVLDPSDVPVLMQILAWCSFVLLARTLFYDRIALGIGAFAGFVWLMFYDAATMPFAAGTAAMVVHAYRSRYSLGRIHVWYLFVWLFAATAYANVNGAFSTVLGLLFWFILIGGIVFRKIHLKRQAREAHELELHIAHMEKLKQASQNPAEEPSSLEQQIYRLVNKYTLPDTLVVHLKGIVTLAEKILQCMKSDPRDVGPGRRFLERYLPLLEKIAARGQILSEQLSDEAQRQKAITELAVVLERVERAFKQQHQALLENDSLDLDAELLTLDNMLKADGFGK
ncbi:5-bromo-4-chloroindolyl phosphate hydrolysis family protein [Kosakonia sp. CFBP8986]|uniref:5-bromo-4-chloroindolyl phosphate hydrolysis family protein n=1 Tax=Kosakonia sp. CFBP8986 TaxID=3096524 RepID=UPI002A6AAFC9|nr:5-bromo-4-chloroindolyl phosphate hydrolysis family protein [Kosakonia sp. CFBP8986]MDY0885977.1 5-bromo-4-chloroindolyl phosphate hydrolysis family protein [Kosakonia sp. CFBP8986]